MLKSVKMFLGLTILFIILTVPLLSGCKGSDTREKVDDTVEELAGKKKIDQMKKMEKDINNIVDQEKDKLDQFDESESDE